MCGAGGRDEKRGTKGQIMVGSGRYCKRVWVVGEKRHARRKEKKR
jgi:hypothetical protein